MPADPLAITHTRQARPILCQPLILKFAAVVANGHDKLKTLSEPPTTLYLFLDWCLMYVCVCIYIYIYIHYKWKYFLG